MGTLQNFQRLQELDTILIWPKIDTVDKSIVIPDELKEVIAEDQSTLCSDGRHILHAGSLVLLGETPDVGDRTETVHQMLETEIQNIIGRYQKTVPILFNQSNVFRKPQVSGDLLFSLR